MEDDSKFWVWFCGIVILGVCIIVITCCVSNYYTNKVAFENGYERGTLIGSTYAQWVKADR